MTVSVWIEPWDRTRSRGLGFVEVPMELLGPTAERRDDGDAPLRGSSDAA
jgi:hypothetical protein